MADESRYRCYDCGNGPPGLVIDETRMVVAHAWPADAPERLCAPMPDGWGWCPRCLWAQPLDEMDPAEYVSIWQVDLNDPGGDRTRVDPSDSQLRRRTDEPQWGEPDHLGRVARTVRVDPDGRDVVVCREDTACARRAHEIDGALERWGTLHPAPAD
ncbi:MAG: hypothetical protein ACHQZR_04225 [Candidatus Limnocylindrales bacterium]